jgi:homeobox protein cut-like
MSSGGEASTTVKAVLDFWSEFDLDTKRLSLDQSGLQIQNSKEESIRSRKGLAEHTKKFRKYQNEEKIKNFPALLKAYQEEVDRLTKRAKYSDSSFLALYKSLYEAPDPVAAISASIQQNNAGGGEVSALKLENQKLKQEVKESDAELGSLKNQDIKIRQLEDQIENMGDKLDDDVDQKAEERTLELKREFEDQHAQTAEREQELLVQLSQAQESLLQAQQTNDLAQSELFELRQKMEQQQAAQESTMDLEDEDDMRLNTLERENRELQVRVSTLTEERGRLKAASMAAATAAGMDDSAGEGGGLAVAALEDALMQKSSLVQTLQDQVDKFEMTLRTQALEQGVAEEKWQEEQTQHLDQIAQLEADLKVRPSREEATRLRHELQVLKALEYNVVDESGSERGGGGVDRGGESGAKTDAEMGLKMEQLLLSRVRRAEGEVTKLGVELGRREEEIAKIKQREKQMDVMRSDQASLILRLEDDLHQAQNSHSNNNGNNGNNRNRAQLESADLSDGSAKVLADVLGSGSSGDWGSQSPRDGGAATGAATGDAAMIGIVQAQRDRFRARLNDLEAQQEKVAQQTDRHRQRAEKLEKDNVALYEKIRYLQHYSGGDAGKGGSGSSARRANSNQMEEGLEEGASSVESKYQQMYEEKMNPFTAFHRSQKQMMHSKLSTPEKIVLSSSRLITATKFGRTFVLVYTVCLHGLVWLMLMHHAHAHTNI